MSNWGAVNDNVLYFPQSLNYNSITSFASLGGSSQWSVGTISLCTGGVPDSTVMIQGMLAVYVNQQPYVSVKMNAAFSEPAVGLVQTIGLGNAEEGIFVGYNGLDFGILARSGGKRQYWVVHITSPCTATGTIQFTLLGQSHSIPVVMGMTEVQIMYTLCASTSIRDANIQASVNFDTVTLYTIQAADFAGLATSIDFGSTGVTGSVEVAIAGVAATETWVLESNFNAEGRHAMYDIPRTNMNVYEFLCSRWSMGMIAFRMLNTHNDDMTTVHEWYPSMPGFNTSKPYHPTIYIKDTADPAAAAVHCLCSSMATISSGTPSTCTNRTSFSALFSCSNWTVTQGVNTVICAFSVPLVLNGEQNMMTACISAIKIVTNTPRPVRVQAILGGVADCTVPVTQHLPWSCVQHATPQGCMEVTGGLQYGSVYVKDRAVERVMTFDQLWCVPGTTFTVSVTSAQDPVTMSVDCEVLWFEV